MSVIFSFGREELMGNKGNGQGETAQPDSQPSENQPDNE